MIIRRRASPLTRRLHPRRALAVAILALLAACSGPGGADDAMGDAESIETPSAPVVANSVEADAEETTIGGDGSPIRLSALTRADIEGARLSGELGCGFSTPAADSLLVAMGVVASDEAAQGVIKVGDSVERIAAPGGFDAMIDGVVFTGPGATIAITPTGPAAGGGESPPRPATLTYDRADGARRTFEGEWTCGP